MTATTTLDLNGATVDIDATGAVTISGALAGIGLVLEAPNAAGAIDINSGTGGIDAGTAFVFNCSDLGGGFDINAGTAGVDMDSTGQVNFDSSQAAATAIVISASNAAGGVQLSTGTGGVSLDPRTDITQITSIVTGVIANGNSGVITTFAAATAANGTETFVLTNSHVAATSIVNVFIVDYAGTGNPVVTADGAALNAALQIGFMVLQ